MRKKIKFFYFSNLEFKGKIKKNIYGEKCNSLLQNGSFELFIFPVSDLAFITDTFIRLYSNELLIVFDLGNSVMS